MIVGILYSFFVSGAVALTPHHFHTMEECHTFFSTGPWEFSMSVQNHYDDSAMPIYENNLGRFMVTCVEMELKEEEKIDVSSK